MGRYHLHVAEVVNSKTIKLPTEADGSLLLTTLDAQFPGVSGLKFQNNELSGMSHVHLAHGRFQAPHEDGWGDRIYYCVWPKKVWGKKRKLYIEDEEDCKKRRKAGRRKDNGGRCSDLIVLSLPWKTTDVELKEYFESFGEVVHAQVNKNTKTGGSRGFGFIRFATLESQVRALSQRHNIQGRWCDVRIPDSKESQKLNVCTKIHVGGLTRDIKEEDLREHFSQFGEVTHVFIPKPFWPFAFVTFVNGAVAQSLIKEEHTIKGVRLLISDSDPWGNYPERNILLQKYNAESHRERSHSKATTATRHRHTDYKSYRDEDKTNSRSSLSRRREHR